MKKFTSITKVLTAGVLALGLASTSHSDNADAKESVRVAPVSYVGKDTKGLYFDDYTVKDYEKQFLVSDKQAKKLKLNKKYEFNKAYIGYFNNEVDVKSIHEATEKDIVRKSTNKFVYAKTDKQVELSKEQYADLKDVKNAIILVDKVNGKKVLKFDYSFVTKTYKYKITKIDGNDVYGTALNYKSKDNSGIFLYKNDLKFNVAVGDSIEVVYGEYGDEFKSIKKNKINYK